MAVARQWALRAIGLAPDFASPHITLGSIYAQQGQTDIAAHELDEALRLDRFDAAVYGALADLYEREGREGSVDYRWCERHGQRRCHVRRIG